VVRPVDGHLRDPARVLPRPPGRAGRSGAQRSSWTWQGEPLPFIPYDDAWLPADPARPSYTDLYEQSLRAFPDEAAAAEIPAERFTGDLLLLAGGDDQVWLSADFARRIAVRRGVLPTQVVSASDAGHRIILPVENPSNLGRFLDRGGNPDADRAHGVKAWPYLLKALDVVSD
jgi:hypothetical protein